MRFFPQAFQWTVLGLFAYTFLLFGCGQAMLSDEYLANRSKKEFVKMKEEGNGLLQQIPPTNDSGNW